MMTSAGIGCAPDGTEFGKPSYFGFWVSLAPWGPWRQVYEDAAWTPGGNMRGHSTQQANCAHGATRNQSEKEWRMEDRNVGDQLRLKSIGQSHNDREDHRCRAHDRSADQHWLGSGFKRIPCAIVFFEVLLRSLKLRREAEVLFDVLLNTGKLFDS